MLKDSLLQFGVFYALCQCAFGFGEYHDVIAKVACANDVYLSLFMSACVHLECDF